MGEYANVVGGGVLAFIIVREVLGFLRTRQNGGKGAIEEIRAKLGKLYEWHDKDNPNHPGAKAWYTTEAEQETRRLRDDVAGVQRAMDALRTIGVSQHETLREILVELKRPAK